MRGPWKAYGLSTKSRTPSGLPYFGGSIGLNPWRGEDGMVVEGSYRYPPKYLDVLSEVLSELSGMSYYPALIPIRVVFQNASILTGAYGVRNGAPVIDLIEPSWVDIVQLMGRMGVGVTTEYRGDIPLNFVVQENAETAIRAFMTTLIGVSPYALAVSSARYAIATGEELKQTITENSRLIKEFPVNTDEIMKLAVPYYRTLSAVYQEHDINTGEEEP